MTYQPGLYRRVPTDQRVQVHSGFQFGRFSFNVNAGSSRNIQVTQLDAFVAAYQNWLLGPYKVLNFAIAKAPAGSAMLRVDVSFDGNNYDHLTAFPLTGNNVIDSVTGYELSGFSARFVLVNGSDGAGGNFSGWLEVRGA